LCNAGYYIQAWDTLKNIHESRDPVRKTALYKQRMEKKTNMTMIQYVTEFASKSKQIIKADIEIPGELLLMILLDSLSTEYEKCIDAMESRDEFPPLRA